MVSALIKIKTIGVVSIAYHEGHAGPRVVECMSEYDYGRLANIIDAFNEHARLVDDFNALPTHAFREALQSLLGLPAESTRQPHLQSKTEDFAVYTAQDGRAVQCGTVRLEPKHIKTATFTGRILVTN